MLTKQPRITQIDILCGIALTGILLVNIFSISKVSFPKLGTLDWYLANFFDYAIEQRFFPIFHFYTE
jgi:uncharacterized membrane protein YeiB